MVAKRKTDPQKELNKLGKARDKLLDMMIKISDKSGLPFSIEHNTYVPEGAKCEHCGGSGKVEEDVYSLPFPERHPRYWHVSEVERVKLREEYDAKYKEYKESKTGTEEVDCDECDGTGEQKTEYGHGWQKSYC